MHFKVRQNWMAASLKTAGRPARPLGAACHANSGSSQTVSAPRRSSETLYAGQFVVRYRARGSLLIFSGYQDCTLGRTRMRSHATTPLNSTKSSILDIDLIDAQNANHSMVQVDFNASLAEIYFSHACCCVMRPHGARTTGGVSTVEIQSRLTRSGFAHHPHDVGVGTDLP